MKRDLSLVIVAVILACIMQPLSATTYTYVVRELAQTFTARQTFTAGATISGSSLIVNSTGSVAVDPDASIDFDAGSGDSYISFNADTGCLESWQASTLAWQFCASKTIIGTCPTSLSDIEFGGICKDTSTGKIMYRGTLEQIP